MDTTNDPADRNLFLLNDEQWEAFWAALEREAQVKPRLAALLAEH